MLSKTPIQEIKSNISDAQIFIKRDDLIPFSFGGNKVRIAQEYYADMDAKGKNCMIGYGNARSNLCRVLANMSYARQGVCHIISPSEDNGSRIETSNSRIVKSCGSIVHLVDKSSVTDAVEAVIAECEEAGFSSYYMYGDKYGKGNEAVPVRAYVKVYNEIQQQCNEMGIKFDTIFLATGTGMTQAGLVAGRQLSGGSERIVGISVARKKEQEIQILLSYVKAYFDSIDVNMATGDIEVVDNYLCGGYGQYDDNITSTIRNMFLMEGIPLDPTYTGKAFYGMLQTIIKEKITGNVLFIHTGGTPLFFDNINLI